MAGANTKIFSDSDFDTEVLKSDKPVLVDFWAEWCGPCKMMTSTVDAIANDYQGRAKIGKVNVDETTIGSRYQIRGIPAFLLFKDGKIVDHRVGAVGKGELQKMLDKHVAAGDAEPILAPGEPVTVHK